MPGTHGNITREGPAAWDKEAVCPAEYQGPLGGCIGEICEGKTCVFRSLSSAKKHPKNAYHLVDGD